MLTKIGEYPRLLAPGHEPYDPLELARRTEEIIAKGNMRKYSRFGWTHNYGKGIATAYACGCCLRCVFCWGEESRDFPENRGGFYSPQQVTDKLIEIVQKARLKQARVSGAEPTLGRTHLLDLLALIEESDFETFVLETNGILLGADYGYVRELSRFEKLYVRVSLKAGTAEDFTRITGAKGDAFNLPFQAIRYLREMGINFDVATMSADPRLMTPIGRICLIKELAEIDPSLVLRIQEEMAYSFPMSLRRMKSAMLDSETRGVRKWFLRSYVSIHSLQDTRFSLYHSFRNIRERLLDFSH